MLAQARPIFGGCSSRVHERHRRAVRRCRGDRHVPSGLRTALVVFGMLVCAAADAQPDASLPRGYPSKPIRLLVGNAPGGGIDIVARSVGQKLSERWGRPVVVDNRAGAAGIIALEVAAQAPPDGYTFLVISGSLIASAGAQQKVRFDVRKAYTPITQIATVAYVLMINAGLPPSSVTEFIAYAKLKPNALSYGSSGIGGAGHLAGALFCEMAGVNLIHVPYKGAGPALADLVAGQFHVGFSATISGMPHVRAGKLKALGVTSLKRTQAFPDVPTIAEAGVPDFQLINWYGLFAPAGIPRPIAMAMHRAMDKMLGAPDVQASFAKDGAESAPSASPEAFAELLAKEVKRWEALVKLPGFADTLR